MQRRIAALSILAAGVAACNGVGGTGNIGAHMTGQRQVQTVTPGPGSLSYQGGPLVATVRVVPVYWSSSVALQSQITAFYNTIVKSPYIDWLSEYDINGYTFTRGTVASAVVDTKAPAGTTVDDTAIETELARLIDAHTVPQPTVNTIYAVHFPPNVTVTFQGYASCQTFCALHNSFVHNGANIYYTINPDQTSPSSPCRNGCGPTTSTTDTTTFLASHELIDTITDPDVGTTGTLGWFDNQDTAQGGGGELAQICDPQYGTVDGYAVAKGWSIKYNQCLDQVPCNLPVCGTNACGTLSNSCGSVTCAACGVGDVCSNNVCEPESCQARGCVGTYPHCRCR